MNEYRTHNCGELRIENIGESVKIAGWVQTIRDLGGIVFLDIRDQYGITQAVIEANSKLVDEISKIPTESTVSITGKLRRRSKKTINPNLKTGLVEVFIEKYEILGKRTKNLPFEINVENKVTKEDLRLQYRFLDLRNEKTKNNILLRSDILQFLRNQMIEQGFTEVQTPILTSSSPEGARDYIVPSRVHPGEFYALPQAPQQFKQLLMVSGIDRYFQIAPCFRDEDSRADRAPGEFYQLDMEMAFSTQEDVFKVIENVIYNTVKNFSKGRIKKAPFERISYKEAMLKYGTDKPDLRNPLIIQDVTDIFQNVEFNAFKSKTVRAIVLPNATNVARRFYDSVVDFAISKCGAKGLAWLKVNEGNSLQGPIAKFIEKDAQELLLNTLGAKVGDSVFFISDREDIAVNIAGQLRQELANRLELCDKDIFKFCWIVDFPMYELDDNGKIVFSHNPFSMPQGELKDLKGKEVLKILAYQYDLVCNGIELASGAIRNHNPKVMIEAFNIAGYDKKIIEDKFPALFNAFHYGAPPHGGIAIGIDRMIMMIINELNIREVIAFPKNSKAQDLLMGAPGKVTDEQLKEVHIKLDLNKKDKK